MNDMITALTDFVILAPHLLNAEDTRAFEIWLEKLELIDRRALFFYLKEHKNEIPAKHLKIAQRRFTTKL